MFSAIGISEIGTVFQDNITSIGILLSALTGEVIADLVKGRTPSLDLTPWREA